MKNLLKSNLFYGITSVLLAIFLLFYVDSIDNKISEKTFNVNLTPRNLTSELLIDKTPITIKVRVSGNKTTFYSLTSRDIIAWVDLSQAKPGLDTYNIQTSLPAGTSLIWVDPKTVDIYLDEIGSKTIDVRYNLINSVAEGYGSFEPIISPNEITVNGPKLILAEIDHAVVGINLSGLKADYQANLPFDLINKNSEIVVNSEISLSQPNVKVEVPVTENMSSKSVQVRTAITGEIDKSRIVESVEIMPTTVRITGAFDIIKDIEYLTTETFDLNTLEQSYNGMVNLNVPEGVGVLDGTQVELSITLAENFISRKIDNIPVEIRNAPEGKIYGTVPSNVAIDLKAYPWIFENYANDQAGYNIDIKAYVDLANELASSQEYEIKMETPEGFIVEAITPTKVRVHQ